MAYRYSDMGYDGCTCLSEDARCLRCNSKLEETDGQYCSDCERKSQITRLEATECLLDELGEFVTNL